MVEYLYDNLTVIDATRRIWRNELLQLLGHKENRTLKPLEAILNIAQQLGTKTVVVEKEYVDSDFLDEFRVHYSRHFRDYERFCIRIHFFAHSFTKGNLPYLNLFKQDYLGLSIVRPTLSFCTGRTILRSPKHDGDSTYTLCKADFEANLSGNVLPISGMPFIQQDTNVGVCAQATLWMASLYMHQKYALARFRPSEITAAATRYLTIGPIRRGLATEQVLGALREMGYTPALFVHRDVNATASIIYAYVESELPVILLVERKGEGHAVVVIGHDFHQRPRVDPSWKSNIHWIDNFIIHDDAAGPYANLLVKGRARSTSALHSIEEHARYIIVPLPPAIAMQADDVFDHIATLVDHLNKFIADFGMHVQPFRFSTAELTGLVFRTFLRMSNDFKNDLPKEMSDFFRHRYKSMRMPRYIWIIEISQPRYLNKARSKNRKIIGEIVIDSTADRHAHIKSYLAIHLSGRMIIRQAGEDVPTELYVDPTEKPYRHLIRE